MSDSPHPSRRALEEFLRGDLPPAETRRAVRHLLAGCPTCKRTAARLLARSTSSRDRQPATREPGPTFDALLPRLRASEALFARERSRAPRLLGKLLRHPPARQLVLVLNSPGFQILPLCDLVLEEAFRIGLGDPVGAVAQAEVGLALAGKLDTDRYGEGLVRDFQARAWMYLGNARRIASDFQGAAEAFQSAEEALASGSGDPLEEARLWVLSGRLAAHQSDLRGAHRLFDRAISVYRRLNESHLEGRTLLDKGTSLLEAGQPEEAIDLLRRGLALLEPGRDPRRALVAKHNLVFNLHACGRFREALELLEEVRSLHASVGTSTDRLRLRWLEGRIARDQGKLLQAEEAFLEVRDAFLGREMAFDAAQISLDLSAVYLEQGRFPDIASLAAQLLEIFAALKVHREALAALTLFRQAAEARRVTSRWISELRAYVARARNDPHLKFRWVDSSDFPSRETR